MENKDKIESIIAEYQDKVGNLEYHLNTRRNEMFLNTISNYETTLRCYKSFIKTLKTVKWKTSTQTQPH